MWQNLINIKIVIVFAQVYSKTLFLKYTNISRIINHIIYQFINKNFLTATLKVINLIRSSFALISNAQSAIHMNT